MNVAVGETSGLETANVIALPGGPWQFALSMVLRTPITGAALAALLLGMTYRQSIR